MCYYYSNHCLFFVTFTDCTFPLKGNSGGEGHPPPLPSHMSSTAKVSEQIIIFHAPKVVLYDPKTHHALCLGKHNSSLVAPTFPLPEVIYTVV